MKGPIDTLPQLPLLTRAQAKRLFERVQNAKSPIGRRNAINQVLLHYGRWTAVTVHRRCRGRFSEGECVSIALDLLAKAAVRYRPGRGNLFGTFFRRRLAGEVQSRLRQQSKHSASHVSFDELSEEKPARGAGWEDTSLAHPVEKLLRDEQLAVVKKSLAKLRPVEQDVLQRRLANQTFAEIGQALKVTKQRAQQIYGDAIKLLAEDETILEYRMA